MLDVFLYLVILPYCNAISLDCKAVKCLHLFCEISMFVSERMLYKRFKCFKNLMTFLFNYLGDRRGGGCTNACICMGSHSQPLQQNWMYTKLGRDEVFMAAHMGLGVSVKSAQGWIKGRAKIGHEGRGPFLKKNCFTLEGYSNKPNA